MSQPAPKGSGKSTSGETGTWPAEHYGNGRQSCSYCGSARCSLLLSCMASASHPVSWQKPSQTHQPSLTRLKQRAITQTWRGSAPLAPESATEARTAANLKPFMLSMPQSTRKARTPITAPIRMDSSHFHVSAGQPEHTVRQAGKAVETSHRGLYRLPHISVGQHREAGGEEEAERRLISPQATPQSASRHARSSTQQAERCRLPTNACWKSSANAGRQQSHRQLRSHALSGAQQTRAECHFPAESGSRHDAMPVRKAVKACHAIQREACSCCVAPPPLPRNSLQGQSPAPQIQPCASACPASPCSLRHPVASSSSAAGTWSSATLEGQAAWAAICRRFLIFLIAEEARRGMHCNRQLAGTVSVTPRAAAGYNQQAHQRCAVDCRRHAPAASATRSSQA